MQELLSTAVFSPKNQCLLSSVARWRCPMVDTEGKMFEIQVCRLLENALFLGFSGKFIVCTYVQVFLMRVCKYINQTVRRIAEQNGKSFKGVSKTKKKKKHMKRLSFITQFKIEFLLPFTGWQKSAWKNACIGTSWSSEG